MEIPIIELRIRGLGQQVTAAIAVHEHEISGLISKGVDAALSNIADKIIAQAADEAGKQLGKSITEYFSYGEGHTAIKLAVGQICKPIADAIISQNQHT